MIKTFQVQKLNGKRDYKITFDERLNILTGKNGSGKTTLLKMLWYMISPNVERLTEVDFKFAMVETDDFSVEVDNSDDVPKVSFSCPGKKPITIDLRSARRFPKLMEPADVINQHIRELNTRSVFFPTFRRIEGGFSLDRRQPDELENRRSNMLQESLERISRRIGVDNHLFVASISTDDIENLFMRKFAEASEQTTKLHVELSKSIQEKIRLGGTSAKNARQLINDIKKEVQAVDQKRESILAPFNVLTKLADRVYKDKGIRFSSLWTLGNSAETFLPNQLSAGEKQMLGFLCYNAFSENTTIFIDEPELSLHVDWQRSLFGYLLDQKSSNQFIVSTHSPFIYSKYPKNEIMLDEDKGDCEEE